jgi:hypothetical protein
MESRLPLLPPDAKRLPGVSVRSVDAVADVGEKALGFVAGVLCASLGVGEPDDTEAVDWNWGWRRGVPHVSHASSMSFGREVGVMYEEWRFFFVTLVASFACGVSKATPCSCQNDAPMSIRGSDPCVLMDGLVRIEEPDVRL